MLKSRKMDPQLKEKSISRERPRKNRDDKIGKQGLYVTIISILNIVKELNKNINTMKKEMKDPRRNMKL